MKIRISTGDEKAFRINLRIPTRVVFSNISANIASRVVSSNIPSHISSGTAELTPHQMRVIFRELRQAKQILHGEPLVEVISSGGEYVRIDL